jgi:hypothetical protein
VRSDMQPEMKLAADVFIVSAFLLGFRATADAM